MATVYTSAKGTEPSAAERVEAAAKVLRDFWRRHPDAMGPEPGDDPPSLSLDIAQAMLRAADAPLQNASQK